MKNVLLYFLFIVRFFVCDAQVPQISLVIVGGIEDGALKQRIESNTSRLLMEINESFRNNAIVPEPDSKAVTANGIEVISDLWKEGHFFCSSQRLSVSISRKNESWQIRNIPLVFERDTFDGVVEYLQDGLIDDFYIGLEEHQVNRVLDGEGVIDQTRREIILNFLENFRTAYIRKDTAYISKLFSDKALIIVGKVLKTDTASNDQFKKTFTSDQVVYQVKTKSHYIQDLQTVFNSSSYLRLYFRNIEVVKHRKFPGFYGILLQQKWDASNYTDDGWLFILVQFKINEDPIIHIRTWQLVEDTQPNEVFGSYKFIIPAGEIINR